MDSDARLGGEADQSRPMTNATDRAADTWDWVSAEHYHDAAWVVVRRAERWYLTPDATWSDVPAEAAQYNERTATTIAAALRKERENTVERCAQILDVAADAQIALGGTGITPRAVAKTIRALNIPKGD